LKKLIDEVKEDTPTPTGITKEQVKKAVQAAIGFEPTDASAET